jgi:TrmH family RNA methyltransferase
VHVTSRQNPVVKRFREAAQRGRTGGLSLLDGAHLVSEALDAAVPLEVVAFSTEAVERRHAELASRCRAAGAQVFTVAPSLIGSMTPVKQPSGVVALARIESAGLPHVLESGAPQLVLILDRVQDPGNVGAIVRVAEATGATGVIAGPGTADPFGWKALRGSMGSAFRLPIAIAPSLGEACLAAHDVGLTLFATVPRDGTPIESAGLDRPCAILLGGEGAGLAPEVMAAADESLTIPMRPPVESLNVSIAAALVLYEAARQRTHVAL